MIEAGNDVIDFKLQDMNGNRAASKIERENKLLLVVMFKISCPTCQLTLPYMEKIFKGYDKSQLTVWGVSQNSLEDTKQFAKQYELTFNILLDENFKTVSDYALEFVPAIYLMEADDKILWSQFGWNRDAMNELTSSIAKRLETTPVQIIDEHDSVLAMKPG